MCVKYKKKKEEEDEVAELDCRNIITTGQYLPQVYTFDVVILTQVRSWHFWNDFAYFVN